MKVVVIGGGFGGLSTVQALEDTRVEVTLIDRRNFHLFQPLLYQVATGALSPANIAAPLRSVLRKQSNVRVILGEVSGFDLANRQVILDDRREDYDVLVVATGSRYNYFGHAEWQDAAPSLKTLEDANEVRTRILNAFEQAELAEDPAEARAWMTFVVIGGGPTGVELAGQFAEIARHTLKGEFRRIDPHSARVMLVEGANRILGAYPPDLSMKAQLQLERLGVTTWVGRMVTNVDAEGVSLGNDRISAKTVVWAAGVAASPLVRSLDVPLDRAGRVKVEPDLSVPGHSEIFVIGDLASLEGVPGIAPAAKQMGRLTAQNIKRLMQRKKTVPFRYRDWGQLATIGRNSAVAVIGKLKLSGYIAWLMWLLAHIYFLINFRNRVVVMFDWAWSYWTYDRYARIVIQRD
jgi:NADH dehydrogenase